MPEPLVAPSTVLAIWLLNYLLHSTVLIGGAWLLSRLDAVGPSTRDVLWKTAMVGALVTSSVAMAADRGSEVRVRAHRIVGAPQCLERVESRIGLSGDRFDRLAECVNAEPGGVPLDWFRGFVGLWLAGAIVGSVRIARRRLSVRALFAGAGPSSRRARTLLAQVAARAGLQPPTLTTSPVLDSPCLLPGGVVALSTRSETELNDGELRAVLAHEVAHLLRRDVFWASVLTGLTSVLWIQPLNRLALNEARETAELICDDWALTCTGERYGLASSISRVAAWSVGVEATAPAVPMAGRSGRGPAERVRQILYGPQRRTAPAWQTAALAGLLLAPLAVLPAVLPAAPTLATGPATFVLEEGGGPTGSVVGRPESMTLERFEWTGDVGGERRLVIARIRSP